ncbi:MAG: hypothetical protein KIT43_07520 [Bauldia sp.]|nr:hypothetical protein [Bauldia sp.]
MATGPYLTTWADCIATHRPYCDRHLYRYDLIDRETGPLHAKWQKLAHCRDALEAGSGHILLIDADARINPPAPPFHAVVDATPEADILCVLGRSGRPNSGMIMFRGGAGSVAAKFLAACIDARDTAVPPEDFVTAEGENGHFIHFLKREPFASRLGLLPLTWNNTRPPPSPADYVTHYAGKPMRMILPPDHPGYRPPKIKGAKARRMAPTAS